MPDPPDAIRAVFTAAFTSFFAILFIENFAILLINMGKPFIRVLIESAAGENLY
jgi:hypothetical protein